MTLLSIIIITVCTSLFVCIVCGALDRDEIDNTFDVFEQEPKA